MIEEFFEHNPYDLDKTSKNALLTKELVELTEFHKKHCAEYASFLKTVGYDSMAVNSIEDIPFYPVRMFKE